MTSELNDEARKSVLDTLETLRQWSNEIDATNDRYLTKALDRIAAAERAMGWPDHVSTSGSGVLAHGMHYFRHRPSVGDNRTCGGGQRITRVTARLPR
jgi:hypothetical protein